MASTADKSRIIHEAVKDRHTSHWDQDMLSRAELEQLMRLNTRSAETNSSEQDSTAQATKRKSPESY